MVIVKMWTKVVTKNVPKGLLSLLIFSLCLPVLASDYGERPEIKKFVDEMVTDHNYNRQHLEALFKQAKRQQSIIDAISRPAEKTKTWEEYRKIFVTNLRISGGVDFWLKNKKTLDRASKEYGVAPQIIVAILGVETRYGKFRGSYRVLDSLSTLAFDYPKRATFFRGQLKEFLLMIREQKFNAEELMGSYAGAMGYGQFIPGSYRAYAVDFDGDKNIDIWNNPVDAIGSVANYFKHHGWKEGQAVTGRAKVAAKHDASIANGSLKPTMTIAELANKGFISEDSFGAKEKATLMRLEAQAGTEHWLGLTNFYAITRYNHSRLYAMAVYQLGQEIDKRFKKT